MQNDAYSKVIEDYCRVSQTIIDKPHLNKHFYADHPNFVTLDSSQQDFYNYLALFIGVLERAYILYRKGWIDEQTWMTWEKWLCEHWFRLELFEFFWKSERLFFTVDFYQHIDNRYDKFKEAARLTTLSKGSGSID